MELIMCLIAIYFAGKVATSGQIF